VRRRIVPVLAVLAAAGVSSAQAWTGPVRWSDPDSLYYQAQSLEVRGVSQQVALRRVFDSPLADAARSWDREHRYARNPEWVAYSVRFYRRRWLVSALAAALSPAFGERSLLIVSLLGYVSVGLLLYMLLSRRFSPTVSATAAVACLWLPPLRWHSFVPMTDSVGLALLIGALIAALFVIERGIRWLPLWLITMALLSVTKENSVVALVAVAWLAVRTRSTRAATLAITGVAVTAPVSVLLGPSLRETIAFAENDFQRPSDSSWGFVVREYPAALWSMVHDDLFLPRLSFWTSSQAMLWYLAGTIVVLALILLLAKSTREDSFFRLMRATLLGAAAFMALAVLYSALRLELVFVPAVAVGFALLIDALRRATLVRAHTKRR
jgi:hypothetical protein